MNSSSKNIVLATLPAIPLRLDSVAIDDNGVISTIRSIVIGATCPVCGATTTRLHSRYSRTLRDLVGVTDVGGSPDRPAIEQDICVPFSDWHSAVLMTSTATPNNAAVAAAVLKMAARKITVSGLR